ncbi:MAG: radical SAM protein [Candidatus Thermoplasmatota archaeon]|nr:radical SAM protein [Candidatus Thermoplasmatota archaeon]
MKKIFNWLNESKYINPLPPACKMCAKGSKLVVLITGLCPAKCFYCPLSFEKGGKDHIFADEWELNNENDTNKLIQEAKYIQATGAGITGGDPLVVWSRTKKYISLLKKTFGESFHIHLYTSGLKNSEYIDELVSAGLDEIRFHPMPQYWNKIQKSPIISAIKNALKTDVDVAFEIPALPNNEKRMFSLVKWADENGIAWVNLNELEYSERNCNALSIRGYVVKNDISAAVKESQETALKVLDMVSKENLQVGIHYCSSSFKDGIQLRNRIKRRAKNVAREHEFISEDGTIIKGVIYGKGKSLQRLSLALKKEFNINSNQLFVNKDKNRIEINILVLEKIASVLKNRGFECFMVEEYPTADALEVEKIPMPV